MTINQAQRAKLLEPVHPGRVKKVKGRGNRYFDHLEGWDVRATLIRIFGFGGFSADVIDVIPGQSGIIVTLRLTIYGIGPDGQDVTYTEPGADTTENKDLDDAVKTAATNALKRAAVNLGDQFGLSLYNASDHDQEQNKRAVIRQTLDQPPPSKDEKVEELRQKISDLTHPPAKDQTND